MSDTGTDVEPPIRCVCTDADLSTSEMIAHGIEEVVECENCGAVELRGKEIQL